MKILVITETKNDFLEVLESCDATVESMTMRESIFADISGYDAYCILEPGKVLDVRLRDRLEQEGDKGKKIFAEALLSFYETTCDNPKETIHNRLIYLDPGDKDAIPGLKTGDLLDEQSNQVYKPAYLPPETKLLMVYKYHIIAHTHTSMSREEILEDSVPGLWSCFDGRLLCTSFTLHNFNKARFAPRGAWIKLIRWLACQITGSEPAFLPESPVRHRKNLNLTDEKSFETYRKEAVSAGLKWMEGFLVDEGLGGIQEGMRHDINPEGIQQRNLSIRTDCCGECAGAFKMSAFLNNREDHARYGENLDSLVYGPMVKRGGLCDGMMRWTESAWEICFQDDIARAVLPVLYECIFSGKDKYFPTVRKALNFLIRTTAKDGTRTEWSHTYELTKEGIRKLTEAEIGMQSAHFNGYYLAALLFAYKFCGDESYLEVGQKGIESIMSIYPDTKREQSETQEMCRMVLPLAILYDVTREENHKEMLYRVLHDIDRLRHPFGGYLEWDTGYKANRSRECKEECSVLTQNGDPVADQLYSMNWLPLAFAYAAHVTEDPWIHGLWRNVVEYFIRTQIISENPDINGAWSRAFDMDLEEIYAVPHDMGWASNCCESGWVIGEVLMGMMLPDVIKKAGK